MSVQQALIPITYGSGIPALIAGAGDRADWRFIEFFTVNIRNAKLAFEIMMAEKCA